MRYETNRIILEPFEKKHTKTNYRNWFIDEEVTKYNSHGLGYFTQRGIDNFLESLDDGTKLVWAILFNKVKSVYVGHKEERIKSSKYYTETIHIGNISLQSINHIYKSAEFAVIIGEKKYWRQGITTEAGKLVLHHGFDRLNLNRIWTGTAKTNIGMQKVAEKLGMIQEGIFRQGMFLNGDYVDVWNYGILKEEWETINLKK